MANKISFLIIPLIPLILSIGIAPILPSIDIIPEADALKSKGTYNKQYGSATKHIVCGAQLCSEISKSLPSNLSEKALKGLAGKIPKEDTRPNILFIVLDDTGFADLSIRGSEIPTPAIDSLIAEGTLFDNYRVQGACSPSRSEFMTGVDHHLNGIGTMGEAITPNQEGKPGYETYLNDRVVSVATLLQDAGYHTILSGKWHLGVDHPYQPSDRGFDQSFSMLEAASNHFSNRQITYNEPTTFVLNGEEVDLPSDFYSSNAFTDFMIEQIDENHGDGNPMFMYMAYTATHDPLMAPQEYIDKYKGKYDAGYEKIREQRLQTQIDRGIFPEGTPLIPLHPITKSWDSLNATEKAKEARAMEIFAAMLDNMDENIGRLLDHLKEIDEYDNTLIYLSSDNGAMAVSIENMKGFKSGDDPDKFVEYISSFDNSIENMGSENSWVSVGSGWAQAGSTPFFGFKLTTTEGGLHVPAIIKTPYQQQASTTNAFATIKDMAPTILDYAQVEHPGTSYNGKTIFPMEGKSLMPLLEGEVDRVHAADEPWATELFDNKAVYLDKWMLDFTVPPYGDGEWHLYNLDDDPTESFDHSLDEPELFEKMKKIYDEYADRVGVVPPVGQGFNVG